MIGRGEKRFFPLASLKSRSIESLFCLIQLLVCAFSGVTKPGPVGIEFVAINNPYLM